MKAAVVHSYAKPEVLDPQSRPGEALIHVAAAGVNPIDPARARGRHEGRVSVDLSLGPPLGLSRKVVVLGDGVRELAIGETVFAWAIAPTPLRCTCLAKVPTGWISFALVPLRLVSAPGCQLISVAAGSQEESEAGRRVCLRCQWRGQPVCRVYGQGVRLRRDRRCRSAPSKRETRLPWL
jgi:hypothetical protein